MLPPPPPQPTLSANPHFATLYTHLTTHILAPNGSTRSIAAQHADASKRLDEARLVAAREEMLLGVLREIAGAALGQEEGEGGENESGSQSRLPRPPPSKHPHTHQEQNGNGLNLPLELRQLTMNIAMYLSLSLSLSLTPTPTTTEPLPPDTETLMADELHHFRQALPRISGAVSNHLVNLTSSLAETVRALTPDPDPDPDPKQQTSRSRVGPRGSMDDLARQLGDLTRTQSLGPPLTQTLTTLSAVQTQHTTNISHSIRTLELTTHGHKSRHLTARAAYLTSVSRGLDLKARILALEREKSVYGDRDVMDVLEGEMERLYVVERGLDRQEREMVGLLGGYESVGREVAGRVGDVGGDREGREGSGEDVFRALGGRYAEVEGEIEEVKRDVERLERRV